MNFSEEYLAKLCFRHLSRQTRPKESKHLQEFAGVFRPAPSTDNVISGCSIHLSWVFPCQQGKAPHSIHPSSSSLQQRNQNMCYGWNNFALLSSSSCSEAQDISLDITKHIIYVFYCPFSHYFTLLFTIISALQHCPKQLLIIIFSTELSLATSIVKFAISFSANYVVSALPAQLTRQPKCCSSCKAVLPKRSTMLHSSCL